MKLPSLALLICAHLAAPAAFAGCDNPSGNAETAKCLGQQLRDTDLRINEIYKQLGGLMSEEAKRRLRDEQRAWLKRRDATCSLDNKESDREKWMQKILEDHVRTVCVVRFTEQRAQELEARLDNPEAQSAGHAWELADDSYALRARTPHEKGKWYFEVRIDQGAIARRAETALYIGVFGEGAGDTGMLLNLRKHNANDPAVVYGVAVDLDQGKYYGRFKQWDAQPGSASGGDLKPGRRYDAGIDGSVALAPLLDAKLIEVNFGEKPFHYPLPAGYKPFGR